MNEHDVRALVREAIERHLGRPEEKRGRVPFSPEPLEKGTRPLFEHSSHILLEVLPGNEMDDGTCLIEPMVRCNHCGFCRSYGH